MERIHQKFEPRFPAIDLNKNKTGTALNSAPIFSHNLVVQNVSCWKCRLMQLWILYLQLCMQFDE